LAKDGRIVNVSSAAQASINIQAMSCGYDLVIRNKLGVHVEDLAVNSLKESRLLLGGARAINIRHLPVIYIIVII
jgi:hypothetical protein